MNWIVRWFAVLSSSRFASLGISSAITFRWASVNRTLRVGFDIRAPEFRKDADAIIGKTVLPVEATDANLKPSFRKVMQDLGEAPTRGIRSRTVSFSFPTLSERRRGRQVN